MEEDSLVDQGTSHGRRWAILPNNAPYFSSFEEWSKHCDVLGLPIVDFRGEKDKLELYELTIEKFENNDFEFRRLDTSLGLCVFSTEKTFKKLNSNPDGEEESYIMAELAPLFEGCNILKC